MEKAVDENDKAELKVHQTTLAFDTDDIYELRLFLKSLHKQLKQKLKDLHMKDNRKRSRKNRNGKQGDIRNALVLDSGFSGHMTGYKSLLSEFEEKAGPSISYGDGNLGKILGYGKIKVGNVIIENLALVAGLKHNLISLTKSDLKDDEGIFVGYPLTTKAFRVYNLRTRTVMESIHVSFDDKKITGLEDSDDHDILRFENEVVYAELLSPNSDTVSPDITQSYEAP
ncbi:hypothetical protein AgCh_027236 [Apium graveolens]